MASSSSSVQQKNDSGIVCFCQIQAKIKRAWTEKNPGRRFYTCRGRKTAHGYEACQFFQWFDLEPPHGWQHEALLEARSIMNQQREEIKTLRDIIASIEREGGSVEINRPSEFEDNMKLSHDECEKLKSEVLILTERSTVYRNVLIASSIGFTIAIGVVTSFWKQ